MPRRVPRGRLLRFGTGGLGDSPSSKRVRVLAVWILQTFWTILGLFALMSFSLSDVRHFAGIGGLIVPLFWLLFVVNHVGVEVDGIYETGVSHRKASLWESLTGRGFQPF